MRTVKIRYYVVGLISLSLSVLIFIYSFVVEQSENMENPIMAILAVVAATIAYIEIYKNSLTSQGEFILNLQQAYTENKDFTKLFLKCWDEYNQKEREIICKKNRAMVIDYLTFFESLYVMLQRGCLKIELIDELFARRFFIVVNNVKIQEEELAKEENYKYYLNIYRLYFVWKEYRENKEKEQKKLNPDYKDELINVNNEKYRDLQKTLKPDFRVEKRQII